MYKYINIKIYLTRDYICTIDLNTNIAIVFLHWNLNFAELSLSLAKILCLAVLLE